MSDPKALDSPKELFEAAVQALDSWLPEVERRNKESGGGGWAGYAAALAVLDAMRKQFPPAENDYITINNQIRKRAGLLKRLVVDYLGKGEAYWRETLEPRLPVEFGRTTRSAPEYARQLIEKLDSVCGEKLRSLSSRQDGKEELNRLSQQLLLHVAQAIIRKVERETESRGAIRLQQGGASSLPLIELVASLLEQAERHDAGVVAHHLVGAKLALRYPARRIPARSHTAADQQPDLPGDYQVGDTAFHVTIAPGSNVIRRCRQNIKQGLRPWILVRGSEQERARRLLRDACLEAKVGLTSIEQFVGQNLEELACFSTVGIQSIIRSFVGEYNRRIQTAERDQARLKIELATDGFAVRLGMDDRPSNDSEESNRNG